MTSIREIYKVIHVIYKGVHVIYEGIHVILSNYIKRILEIYKGIL